MLWKYPKNILSSKHFFICIMSTLGSEEDSNGVSPVSIQTTMLIITFITPLLSRSLQFLIHQWNAWSLLYYVLRFESFVIFYNKVKKDSVPLPTWHSPHIL